MADNSMLTLHTLAELRQRMDPSGMIANIAEVIDQYNDFIGDVPWVEANDKTSHLFTKRVAYPTPSIRRLNQGVTPSKSTTGQDREILMMTEDWSEVDIKLAGLSGNPEAYRYTEDIAFAEGFSQAVPGYFFYGSGVDEEITGLASRLGTVGTSPLVLDAGGTGASLSSIYIVGWGLDAFGIYPAGSQAGLSYADYGKQVIQPALTTRLEVYQSRWAWDFGLVVRDTRQIMRIANINVADPSAASPTDITRHIIYAMNKMRRGLRGRGVTLYCNSDVMTIFDILAKDKTNVDYGRVDIHGHRVMMFRNENPIRQVDQILSTEDQVT
jgi:hypothetical protein